MRFFFALITTSLVFAGCAPKTGAFSPNGFVGPDKQYTIAYSDPANGSLMSGEWSVQNYEYTGGRPKQPKVEGRFQSELDWEGREGTVKEVKVNTFDLLLGHTSNGTIWVRLLPIPRGQQMKHVQVVAENYVNGLTASYQSDYIGPSGGSRRISTKIVESVPIVVFGSPAQSVTFEAVNLDQLEHSPDAPRTLARIVLVQRWFRAPAKGDLYLIPAYLLFGYANDQGRFGELTKDFESLLKNTSAAPERAAKD
jgi:hypothetical protein